MRHNKLTPGSNLVWESSRMMLPEHREALLEYAQECKKLTKPELDEQELEEINRIINQAYLSREKLSLVVYNEYGNKTYQGQVSRVDQQCQRLLLVENGQRKWIPFQDILDVKVGYVHGQETNNKKYSDDG